MAKILIVGERATAEIVDIEPDPADEWCVYRCEHGHEGTDRGNFEDTVQVAVYHVDMQCTGPIFDGWRKA